MKHKAYVLKTVLPQGALFPFDFGSVLGSVTDDGNPVDALILTDGPPFCGYLIESRLIWCDRSEQSEDGKPERNDRLIAVAAKSPLMPKFGDAPKYPWALPCSARLARLLPPESFPFTSAFLRTCSNCCLRVVRSSSESFSRSISSFRAPFRARIS